MGHSPISSCSPHVHVWVKVPFLSLISFCSTLNKTTHHHLYCWYQKKTQTPWEIGFLTNHIYNRHCGRGETPNTRQKLQTRKKNFWFHYILSLYTIHMTIRGRLAEVKSKSIRQNNLRNILGNFYSYSVALGGSCNFGMVGLKLGSWLCDKFSGLREQNFNIK